MNKLAAVPGLVAKFLVVPTFVVALASCGSEDGPMTHEEGSGAEAPAGKPTEEPTEKTSASPAPTPCGEDTWANYGENFFQTNCVECHSKLADYARVKLKSTRIIQFIDEGRMPKNRPLPPEEKTRILNYLRCDAPE